MFFPLAIALFVHSILMFLLVLAVLVLAFGIAHGLAALAILGVIVLLIVLLLLFLGGGVSFN